MPSGTIPSREKLAELQTEKPRRMIMRVLKNRMGTVGKSACLEFDQYAGIFSSGQGISEEFINKYDGIPVK